MVPYYALVYKIVSFKYGWYMSAWLQKTDLAVLYIPLHTRQSSLSL